MSSSAESGTALPVVTGDHVRAARKEARGEAYDSFRVRERKWLEEHNGLYSMKIMQSYEYVIRDLGPTTADFILAGVMLGNRAVRLACEDDRNLYEAGYRNFENLALNPQLFALGAVKWNTENNLAIVFEDDDLVQALMEILQEDARHSTAFTIGHFTLPRLPELVVSVDTTEARS